MPDSSPTLVSLTTSSLIWQNRLTNWFENKVAGAWSPQDVLKSDKETFHFPNTTLLFKNSSKKAPGLDVATFSMSKDNLLGKGAYGNVYQVNGLYSPNYSQHKLVAKNKDKVVKVINVNAKGITKDDIKREYRLCLQAGHMGIKKPVFVDDKCYLVMNRFKGKTLKELIKTGEIDKLTEEEKLKLSYQLLLAFKNQVFDKGIYHRDLKPDNIMVSLDSPFEVNIIDYGLARYMDINDHKHRGNLLYAPPERQNSEDLDPKSEVFSMARIIARLWVDDLSLYQNSLLAQYASVREQASYFAKQASTQLSIPTAPELETLLKGMLAPKIQDRANLDKAITEFKHILELSNQAPSKVDKKTPEMADSSLREDNLGQNTQPSTPASLDFLTRSPITTNPPTLNHQESPDASSHFFLTNLFWTLANAVKDAIVFVWKTISLIVSSIVSACSNMIFAGGQKCFGFFSCAQQDALQETTATLAP